MDSIADSRAASPGEILRANAFRLVVREMGNGVDRLDGAVFVSRSMATEDARADDAAPLPYPVTARVFDLLLCAAGVLGVPAGDLARPLVAGYARPLADGRLEVTAWDAGTG